MSKLNKETLPKPRNPTGDTAGNIASTGLLIRALAFAADKHRDQRRKDVDASPYINHPIALASVLSHEGGINDPVVLCAALLHDTVEDTQTTEAELVAHFGPQIASVVMEVTDDKDLSKEARKQGQVDHAPHMSRQAKLVKLADKISNLRDIIAKPPAFWSAERKHAYFDWCARVVDGIRGTHPVLEAVFDEVMARRGELR